MTKPAFPDEILMAYADGELDETTARAVEEALRGDDYLAERMAIFTSTGKLLKQAAAEREHEPVPDALMSRVRATMESARVDAAPDVVPFPAAPKQRWEPVALAASIALAVGLGAGWLINGQDTGALEVALLDTPGLAQVLAELRSGETRQLAAGEARIIASFTDADGTFCREFELDGTTGRTVVAVACRADGDWQTRLAVATANGDAQGYAPASSIDSLEAYLSAIGASAPLSREAEAEALDALTR
ncbi:anti-sigma factor [Maritimibacter sp. DP1N21-5]|uniref:anti-sigma factor family protein n=1 Tax=Maritimibacter sp. DP1N21-5 TaxID=2836867 RepID=UPI001C44807B|nr:hypothetical protein [Maritimibacter sp. DP1N21-5]MBV7409689.1 hypothetical protein [Maritimibacter sp. DP1N21-5]